MIGSYFPFLFVLLLIAAIFRDDFVFTLFYLFAGVFLIGRWWSRKASSALTIKRTFPSRAFLGESVRVNLEVVNGGLLPVIWLRLQEGLPIELGRPDLFRQVITLEPKSKQSFEYVLYPRRRGYYSIGPMSVSSGDPLGLAGDQRFKTKAAYLIVYPKIIPFSYLYLPSRSPLGTIKHKQPIYEDPSRVLNKRDYIPGDSLRRVDWKSSAAIGRMQVKQFEPSIELQTCIFLNLNSGEYPIRTRIQTTELAIVISASIANWICSQKQSIGLCINGFDPLRSMKRSEFLPPRKGRGQLTQILDVLARIQAAETISCADMLREESIHLSWGTTIIVVAGLVNDILFHQLFQNRRSGFDIVLVSCGQAPNFREIEHQARFFGLPIYQISDEDDLQHWAYLGGRALNRAERR